jgi:hypothetical protein
LKRFEKTPAQLEGFSPAREKSDHLEERFLCNGRKIDEVQV